MKIETTELDLVWFGMTTIAVLYLVAKTIATLERMGKKVDAMVDHIKMEVDSTIARLSKEATVIISNLERNATVCRENLFAHAQAVELKCYRSKSGIAFGLGPRSSKKKSNAAQAQSAIAPAVNSSSIQPALADSSDFPAAAHESLPGKKDHHQLVAIQKCIDKILKFKYRSLSKSFKKNKNKNRPSSSPSPKQELEKIFPAIA